jgi:hypothetical protein
MIPLTANAKRAVSATLDLVRAEERFSLAGDELSTLAKLEHAAVAALDADELFAYQVAVSVAVNDVNDLSQTTRAGTSSL